MHITSGFELTTSLTNILIFIASIYGVITVKKDKLWRLFFIMMSIDSFLGVIVHGIQMSTTVNNIFWAVLSVLFVITINTLLTIFFKLDLKYVIILSIVVTLALLIQLIFNMNFILTFTLYVLLVLILTFYKLLKMDIQNKKIFIWAYIVVVIGGIFLLSRIKLHYLNYNGICHIFTAIAIFMFALALKKD